MHLILKHKYLNDLSAVKVLLCSHGGVHLRHLQYSLFPLIKTNCIITHLLLGCLTEMMLHTNIYKSAHGWCTVLLRFYWEVHHLRSALPCVLLCMTRLGWLSFGRWPCIAWLYVPKFDPDFADYLFRDLTPTWLTTRSWTRPRLGWLPSLDLMLACFLCHASVSCCINIVVLINY